MAGDPMKEAPALDMSVEEEWREIILLQGMLVDRIDRLVARAGCANRRELMALLAKSRVEAIDTEKLRRENALMRFGWRPVRTPSTCRSP